jgi:hypothetical protein
LTLPSLLFIYCVRAKLKAKKSDVGSGKTLFEEVVENQFL